MRELLVVATSYPTPGCPWAGAFLEPIHAAWQRRGVRVTTVTLARGGPSDEGVHQGVAGPVIAVPMGARGTGLQLERMLRSPAGWLSWRRARAEMRRAISGLPTAPDGVVLHWPLATLAPSRAMAHVPGLVVVHGGELDLARYLPWSGALLRQHRSRAATGVWTVRAGAGARAARWLRSDVWLEGSLGAAAAPRSAAHGDPVDEVRDHPFFFAGRLDPAKGVDRIIEALAGLGLGLRVAGDGPERAALTEQASRLGVPVRWLGWLSRDDLALQRTPETIAVLATRRGRMGREEGWPSAIAEALAMRCRVVASRVGGLRELDGEAGVVLLDPAAAVGVWREALGRVRDLDAPRAGVVAEPDEVATRMLGLLGRVAELSAAGSGR